ARARRLKIYGRIYMDRAEAVDLYTKQCSLNVSARDLAVMGATLADGGVNPMTKERVVDAAICHYALAVMATAGLYETSGDWLFGIGLSGKSGIGGGIVTVSPGKGGLGTFAPLLDGAGNSVKGQLASAFLSAHLGMELLVSRPESCPPAAAPGPSRARPEGEPHDERATPCVRRRHRSAGVVASDDRHRHGPDADVLQRGRPARLDERYGQ